MAAFDETPFGLIAKLRSWFFAKDRDITLQSNRTLTLGNGQVIDDSLTAQFVVIAATGDLANERVLTAGTGVTVVDSGAGAAVTVSAPGAVPSGGVIFWPSTAGAIPSGWSTFAAGSGKFLVGTDAGTFTNGSTGGAETVNIEHSHGPNTLATDTDTHSHTSGTLSTDNDNHSHGPNTLSTDSDVHDHDWTGSNVPTGNESATIEVQSGSGQFVARGESTLHHIHTISGTDLNNNNMNTDSHSHSVTTGVTASDSHGHDVNAGSTDNDGHSHAVTTGVTTNSLSTVQSILPVYLVGTWISKD